MDAHDDLINYCKLESVWILINLFFANESELNVILGLQPLNQPNPFPQGNYQPTELEILLLLNKMLHAEISKINSTIDMRMVTQIYFALANLLDTSKELTAIIVDSTHVI